MTYVYVDWPDERPERATHTTVSKPADLKALAKQAVAESHEIEYPPDEYMTNVRVAGVRRLL